MTIKRTLISIGILLILSATAYAVFFRDTKINNDILVEVKKNDFEVNILTTGELRSKSMTMISAPTKLR